MPLRGKEAKARTTVERRKDGEVVSRKELDEQPGEAVSDEPLCNVGYGVSRTYSTAPYEGVKLEVSLHVPCEQQEVDEAFEAAKEWVHGKLTDVAEELGLADEDD